jgi:threonine/homoserine/homoserine lactone efflux protein
MKLYPMYCALAFVTVLSPGPGVVMTLTNALCYGLKGAMGGILGIAVGALVIAGVSSTGIGVLLAASPLVFSIVKCLGSAYLAYLGIRLWRAPAFVFMDASTRTSGFRRNFLNGMCLQFSNPKAIFFFLSIVPQFLDRELLFAPQIALMATTYGLLIIVIHSMYALGAHRTRIWLSTEAGGRAINCIGGTLFIAFGALLAVSGR